MDEVETKLDVHPAFVMPDLAAAIDGVEVADRGETTLRATYWDTDDLRLARAGITLRHRRSDGAGSWQVKLPLEAADGAAGDDGADGDRDAIARAEIDIAGSPARPPRSVRGQVAVASRGADLVPVARLTTRRRTREVRRGGELVAEVVDDEVSILHEGRIAARFRELEVEMGREGTSRDRRVLVATLTAEGAQRADQTPKVMRALGPAVAEPDDLAADVDAVVERLVVAPLRRLRRVDPVVRRGGDPARLAAVLEELAWGVDLLSGRWRGDDGDATPESRIWRATAQLALTAAAVGHAEAVAAHLPEGAARPVLDGALVSDDDVAALRDALAARAARAQARLREALDEPRYARAVDGVLAAATAGALTPTADGTHALVACWRAESRDDVPSRLAVAAAWATPGGTARRARRYADRAHRQRVLAACLRHLAETAVGVEPRTAFVAGIAAADAGRRLAEGLRDVAAARGAVAGKRLRGLLAAADRSAGDGPPRADDGPPTGGDDPTGADAGRDVGDAADGD